jgi:hypothetical protein
MMQVDLCVFLAGNKLEEYTPLFIETLFKNCDTSQLHIHVVEKGNFPNFHTETGLGMDLSTYQPVSENVHNYLLRKKAESPIPFSIYQMHDFNLFSRIHSPGPPVYDQGDDQGNTCNWAMDYCGTNKWVILCHSDIIFVGDAISMLIKEMNDHTSLYGVWNHFYAINREAYHRVGVKFNIACNLRATPFIGNPDFNYVIRHAGDSRCTPDSKVIYGWDIGELMELVMITYGWRCQLGRDNMLTDLNVSIEHLGTGHEYTSNEVIKNDHASKRSGWMNQYGIKRIE